MQRLPNAIHSKEFREQAVRQVEEAGGAVKEVAREWLDESSRKVTA